jgi:hypothetical protein
VENFHAIEGIGSDSVIAEWTNFMDTAGGTKLAGPRWIFKETGIGLSHPAFFSLPATEAPASMALRERFSI